MKPIAKFDGVFSVKESLPPDIKLVTDDSNFKVT